MGIEQHDAVVDEAEDVIVVSQPNTPDTVAGHVHFVFGFGFERHEAVTVEAVETVVRRYPHHTGAVLEHTCRMVMTESVTLVVVPQRVILRLHSETEKNECAEGIEVFHGGYFQFCVQRYKKKSECANYACINLSFAGFFCM